MTDSITCQSAIIRHDAWPLREVFAISRTSMSVADTITVEVIGADGQHGRGSCVPCRRYGETVESVSAALGSLIGSLPAEISHDSLPTLLADSASARNALDAALYDLQAKQTGVPVWQRLGIGRPTAVRTTDTTISLADPETMAAAAARALASIYHALPRLKIKVGGPEKDAAAEAARLFAVREAALTAELIIDSNEGWTAAMAAALIPVLEEIRPLLLEQPLLASADDALVGLRFPCPVFADESAHDRASLPSLIGKYQGVCIKLDKTGGLADAAGSGNCRFRHYGWLHGRQLALHRAGRAARARNRRDRRS